MSSTLYRKYRPAKFSDIVSQQHIVKTLSNAILYNRIGQAYLFTGPRGTGKTTMARLLAKTVNCLAPVQKTKEDFLAPCLKCENCLQIENNLSADIIEIDAASNTGVDNIRELRETAKLSPLKGKYKIYIIDEVHMLSSGAFNALLKILEEPPTHIIFILATTEIHKVPETIISRCQRFDFAKFDIEEIIGKLSVIAKNEKVKIDNDSLELIAISAEGGMRDAESLFEQILTLEKDEITSQKVAEILGISDSGSVEELTELVFDRKTAQALLLINKIYKDGSNLEFLAKNWLEYLRKIMLLSVDATMNKKIFTKMTKEQKENILLLSQKAPIGFVVTCINKISETIPKIKESFIPQLPLESLIVELIQPLGSADFNPPVNTTPPPSASKKIASQPAPKSVVKAPAVISAQEIPVIAENPVEIKTDIEIIQPETVEAPPIQESTPTGEKINIYEVEKNWKVIIDELRKENCSLAMMLSNSKPIESNNNTTINIVIRHAFQKDLINKTENKLTIADISNKITGLRFKVEAITEDESGIKLKRILPDVSQEMIDSECGIGNNSQESLLSDAMTLMGGTIVTE